jgi:putative protease
VCSQEQAAEGKLVGTVTHYFGRIEVGAVKLTDTLRVGDTIRFKGATTDFTQTVDSMQIENDGVEEAGPGDEVGLKVSDRVRQGDDVFRL